MIRGFAKEEDQEEVPMVPQRAYLPPGGFVGRCTPNPPVVGQADKCCNPLKEFY